MKDTPLTHKINFEAWSRTLIGFIRHKGLEQELKDWSGGWPCPIGSDAAPPLVYAAAPELLEALKNAVAQLERMGSDGLASGAIDAIARAEGRS